MSSNLILTGFSGTGKSHVGKLVAKLTGLEFIDVDEQIHLKVGKSISEIFKDHGETYFRDLEMVAIRNACALSNAVISTGGGSVVAIENRHAMTEGGFVVCLEARPSTIVKRLEKDIEAYSSGPGRPLVDYGDKLQNVKTLKSDRQQYYALADWTIHTDHIGVEDVANEVVRAWSKISSGENRPNSLVENMPSFLVETSSRSYPVYADWGLLGNIGPHIRRLGNYRSVFIITDANVSALYRGVVESSIKSVDIKAYTYEIPAGEMSKNLDMAGRIYSWLSSLRCERGDVVVALGGGVVGDLSGFVAATFLRGIDVIQVPTSLAAMVDSSIGGKTGVNLPAGKNLVGAFYQPKAVIADLDTLTTLPQREMASGWAEAIKHGLILDVSLVELFEEKQHNLLDINSDITLDVITRSMAIKANIVGEDEKESGGRRILLNYGHTVGHALEAVTKYEKLLHGEAVSIGMMVAVRISKEMGLISQEIVDRQERLLRDFNLPVNNQGIDTSGVITAIQSDKKVSGKKINWVLLDGIGSAVTRLDVPIELVNDAVSSLSS